MKKTHTIGNILLVYVGIIEHFKSVYVKEGIE